VKDIKEILEKLKNIKDTTASNLGLGNVQIYSPISPEGKEILNIFVEVQNKTYSPLDIRRFEQKLRKKLGCMVKVTSKEMEDSYSLKLIQENIVDVENESLETIQNKLGTHLKEIEEVEKQNNSYGNFFPPSETTSSVTPSSDNILSMLSDQLSKLSKDNLIELQKWIQEKLKNQNLSELKK